MICSNTARKRSSTPTKSFHFIKYIFSFLILHLYLPVTASVPAAVLNKTFNIELLHCYGSVENDVLQSAEDVNFSPGHNPIFFLETSCKDTLDARQACAVESAARFHPESQINVMFTSPITRHSLQSDSLKKLGEYQNIKFVRIHAKEFSKGTGVESIISERLKESHYPIEHAADVLRMVTLNKFGGIYLDTDMIVVNNLNKLPKNWMAKERSKKIGIGAMCFSKDAVGANMTRHFLKEVKETFTPSMWSSNGNGVVERVLLRICPNAIQKAELDCKGVTIFPHYEFYPVSYSEANRRRFLQGYWYRKGIDIEFAYMYHTWNALTKKMYIKNNSQYDTLAWYYCPTIRRTYGDRFTYPLNLHAT